MSNTDTMRDILVLAASAAGDALAAAGIDSKDFAFTIVVWPAGKPEHCSSICASGHMRGPHESTHALAAASEKGKQQPTHITTHTSPGRKH
jgi:hypothetical protein